MQSLPVNNPVEIREFRTTNTLSFAQIYPKIHPKRPFSPHQINQHFQHILESNGRVWTITQSSELVGYAAIYPVPGLPTLVEIEGGIIPTKQRQGFASHLLQHIITTLNESAIQQISHSISNLDTPAARFLQHHNFFIEHEELHLQIENLQACTLHLAPCTLHLAPCTLHLAPCTLHLVDHKTAVSTFPSLYDQSFAGTRWYQPYSPDEINITLSKTDNMLYCLHQNTPIGFAWVRYPNDTTAEIEPIGIVKAWQGKGYGRSFLNAVLYKLQQQDIQQVQIGVWADNQIARHLYHQAGFRHQTTTTFLAYNL